MKYLVLPAHGAITDNKVTAGLTELYRNQFWDNFLKCLPSGASNNIQN